ncbi:MAG TPA: hypothetical protein VF411_06410 [Bacteroidia bacterium]
MIQYCSYCNEPFTLLRKDKRYCSRSCKQMASAKRRKEPLDLVLPYHQKGNTPKGQVHDERVTPRKGNMETERVNTIDVSDIKTGKEERVKPILAEQAVYIPIKSKWINKFYEQLEQRRNETWFNYLPPDKVRKVEWISVHYRCLLECILTISNLQAVEWDDLAELGNALIFLSNTSYYKELPNDYPFTKGIISLRDKLKAFCLETQAEKWIQFRLTPNVKIDLMLQRYELANSFSKISFHQLQVDFKQEHESQTTKRNEEQKGQQPKEESAWQKRRRELNLN